MTGIGCPDNSDTLYLSVENVDGLVTLQKGKVYTLESIKEGKPEELDMKAYRQVKDHEIDKDCMPF